jgi:ACS family tartrate transporter-like MFS transporter
MESRLSHVTAVHQTDEEARITAKVFWRVVPVLFISYVISWLDRSNIGIAALQMNKELGFTPTIFGWGVGIFFIGYLLCEIPSNAICYRVGARLWISRIMITWGILASMNALISGTASLLVLRALLGIAEAGFIPGALLYMTYWIPQAQRAKATGLLFLGLPVSLVFGSPLSGALLGLDQIGGLSGWQWLFFLEGLPAILMGVIVLFLMTERPADAKWLTGSERRTIEGILDREQSEVAGNSTHATHMRSFLTALADPRILILSATNFLWGMMVYGLAIWLPQIVKGLGQSSNLEVGFISAVPYAFAGIVMILWGRHSDQTGERRWHVAIAMFVAGAGFFLSAYAPNPFLAMAAITLAAIGVMAYAGVFYMMPASYLTGAAAAGGIAMVTTLGNLGGFAGPYGIGLLRTAFGDFKWALVALAISAILGGLIILVLDAARFRTAVITTSPDN